MGNQKIIIEEAVKDLLNGSLNVPYNETKKILDEHSYKVTDEDLKQLDEENDSQEM